MSYTMIHGHQRLLVFQRKESCHRRTHAQTIRYSWAARKSDDIDFIHTQTGLFQTLFDQSRCIVHMMLCRQPWDYSISLLWFENTPLIYQYLFFRRNYTDTESISAKNVRYFRCPYKSTLSYFQLHHFYLCWFRNWRSLG